MTPGLFDRDGHLTELGLDRLATEAGRLEAAVVDAAEAHLTGCARCREAQRALAETDRAISLPPRRPAPQAAPNVVPLRPAGGRRSAWLGLGGALMLAAGVLLAVRLSDGSGHEGDGDIVRLKGNPFVFNVWIHDGDSAAMASHDGFGVRAGQRMGFTVQTDAPGYLLVVGRDDTGQRYACFPQQERADGDLAAAPIEAHRTPWALPGAMAFDATPGDERLLAVLCADPFTLAEVPETGGGACGPAIDVGAQRCLARCQRLTKAPISEEVR